MCVRLLFQMDSASGCHYGNHRFSHSHDLFQQHPLRLRQPQIRLVSGGKFVSGVALFSFQSCIQSQAEHHRVSMLCRRHSLCIPVACHCQIRYPILEQMTALCIEHPAGECILDAL